jgi:hypothetical protein
MSTVSNGTADGRLAAMLNDVAFQTQRKEEGERMTNALVERIRGREEAVDEEAYGQQTHCGTQCVAHAR